MKNMTIFAMIGIVLSVAQGARSQEQGYFSEPDHYTSADLERAQKNYQVALRARNSGLAESAIGQVATIGLMVPDRVSNQVKQAIVELASGGMSTSIRYKAYLTMIVFEHPSLFVNEKHRRFTDPDQLFAAIGNRLQQELVADRNVD